MIRRRVALAAIFCSVSATAYPDEAKPNRVERTATKTGKAVKRAVE